MPSADSFTVFFCGVPSLLQARDWIHVASFITLFVWAKFHKFSWTRALLHGRNITHCVHKDLTASHFA
jgi:hypothetical protein